MDDLTKLDIATKARKKFNRIFGASFLCSLGLWFYLSVTGKTPETLMVLFNWMAFTIFLCWFVIPGIFELARFYFYPDEYRDD